MISDTTIIVPNTSRSQDPRGQILSIVDDFIDPDSRIRNFSSIESYWIARSLFLLCDHLNADNQFEESKKIYRMIIAYNLPGFQLAKQLLQEL